MKRAPHPQRRRLVSWGQSTFAAQSGLTRKVSGLARGFSLVELMVAIAIGMMLVAGLAVLFANSSQSGNEIEKSVRQIENGRYALELISEDVNLAGYYGEVPASGMTWVTAPACSTAVAAMGWDNAARTAPVAITGLDATEASALTCLSNHKAGSVAVVLRRLDTAGVLPGASTNGSAYLQTSRCLTDPNATRFILSTVATDFTLRGLACTAGNTVNRYLVRIYYVATCNECGVDTVPTLKRVELRGDQMRISPLAEGIEDIGYDYGFDTNGDGSADVYLLGLSGVAGAPENDWSNVVGVRINLLSRSTEPSPGFVDGKTYALGIAGTRGPFTDGHKRRAYAATSRLNNVAGPRETP